MKKPLRHFYKTSAALLIAFLMSSAGLFAQQPTDTLAGERTKFIGKISHWLAAYGASGEDFMREKRNAFKSAAFAEVYIEGIIDHPAWMFTMLNRVTQAKYAEKQTPYILFGVKFKPQDDNLDSYEISLSLQEGSAIAPQRDDGIVSDASARHLGGKTYAEPVAAEADLEKAIGEALDGLRAKLGNSLAPKLMVRYQDEVFWNGHEIPILDAEGNSVELEAIDKDGALLSPDEITWTNADPFQSRGVVDMTGTQTKAVTLRWGNDAMTVTLNRVSVSQDINELLKALIIEALSAKKQEVMDTLAVLKLDSAANATEIQRYLAGIDAGNFPLEGNGNLAPMFETPIVRPDSTALFQNNDIGPNLLALKQRKKVRSAIRRKMNVVALADLIVDHPDRVTILLDELLRSSGQLVARIILNRDSQGQRTELRNIVLDFLNKNLERVAGNHYPSSLSQEPPLVIPPVTAQQPTFDPQKFLYVNPRMSFPGRDQLIQQLTADVPPATYVFINYSQDVNLTSYQARAKGTRPMGLPEGASYRVFTVLHMPGSLLEMHLGEEGLLYESWTSLEGDIIPNFTGLENSVKSFLSPTGDVFSLPANARDFTFINGYLVKFTIDSERYLSLLETTTKEFSGYFHDAPRDANGYYNIQGAEPYQTQVQTTSSGIQVLYALKSGSVCGQFEIGKATFTGQVNAQNDGGVGKSGEYYRTNDIKTTALLASHTSLSSMNVPLNCVTGRAREIVKFIVEHYRTHGVQVGGQYENELITEMSLYTKVHVKGLDGDYAGGEHQQATIKMREMLNYGHDAFLKDLKDKTLELLEENANATRALIIEFEDFNVIREIFFVYDIAETLDADCALGEHVRNELNKQLENRPLQIDMNFITAVMKAGAKDMYESMSGNELLELLSCLLKEMKATESLYNPNRFDHQLKPAYELVLQKFLGLSPESLASKIPMEITNYTLSCSCGAWNSLIDLVLGLSELGSGVTQNPFDLYTKLSEFGSNITSEGGIGKMGEGVWLLIKEHHGYVNGYGWDGYQATYAACYDAVFVASCFIGIGELKLLSQAGKAGDLSAMAKIVARAAKAYPGKVAATFDAIATISNAGVRKIALEIVEGLPDKVVGSLPPTLKGVVFSSAVNEGIAIVRLTDEGVSILRPVSQSGSAKTIIYESAGTVTDLQTGKTGKLRLVDEGDGAISAVVDDVARGGAKTSPSKIPDINAKPRGSRTAISEADDAATRRSLTKENESAETLAKHGYDVEQNPVISGTTRKPDYLIESKVFDCYSPSSSNARNIASNIELKVTNEQAKRIILNLDDSTVTLEALKGQLSQYPIQGLEEIILIQGNQVTHFYPF